MSGIKGEIEQMKHPPVVAIAGVTGAVGQEFLRLIEERRFPFSELKMLASARSVGKTIDYAGKTYTVEELSGSSFDGVDIALFENFGIRKKNDKDKNKKK